MASSDEQGHGLQGEVQRLVALYEDAPRELIGLLGGQLSVLKAQAQTLIGISGLCITVTGFSGHNMVRAGQLPAGLMVSGIAVILLAIVFALRVLANIRWVTQELTEPIDGCVEQVVARRDRQQRVLSWAGAAVAIGLALYTAAVMIAALSGTTWTPP